MLGSSIDEETLDTVWVLTSPETWAKLHDERDWSLDTYRRRVATMLNTLLPSA
ncbi:hypothetical protein [Jannaschia sp. R86511]|uniref:hypothetical protein n=1 Tax=Jannaschia sp. R86511 TaxID=3093853 RepID=UPI0036D31594